MSLLGLPTEVTDPVPQRLVDFAWDIISNKIPLLDAVPPATPETVLTWPRELLEQYGAVLWPVGDALSQSHFDEQDDGGSPPVRLSHTDDRRK